MEVIKHWRLRRVLDLTCRVEGPDRGPRIVAALCVTLRGDELRVPGAEVEGGPDTGQQRRGGEQQKLPQHLSCAQGPLRRSPRVRARPHMRTVRPRHVKGAVQSGGGS